MKTKISCKPAPGHACAAAVAAVLASILIVTPTVVHATALGDLAATMQPGEWKKLSTNGFDNGAIMVPHGGSGHIAEYTDEALRDPIAKKIYIVGCVSDSAGGGGYQCPDSEAQDARFVIYSEITNTWSDGPTIPVRISPHSYDHAALDPTTGDYYYRVANVCEVWRKSGSNWTRLPDIPDGCSYNIASAIEYFPELGGLVYVGPAHGGEAYLYKPGSSGWITIPINQPVGAYHNATEYSAKRKLLYMMGGETNLNVLLIMDAQGKVRRAADSPAKMGQKVAVNTVDPQTGNFVLFAEDGKTYEYNPDSDSWKQTGTHPLGPVGGIGGGMFHVAVPVLEHGIIFAIQGGGRSGYAGTADAVWIYKHSPGRPAPSDTTPPARPLGLKAQ
jgi:hypothetical protein